MQHCCVQAPRVPRLLGGVYAGPSNKRNKGEVVMSIQRSQPNGSERSPAQAAAEDDEAFNPITALPRPSQETIVLIGAVMGVLVYASRFMLAREWAWLLWTGVWPTLLLGGFASLSLVLLRDRLWWRCIGLVAVALFALHSSVYWLSGGVPKWRDAAGTWLVCAALMLFIALAWVQAVLQSRHVRAVRYSSLFAHAWHNAMVYGLVVQFVGLCWLVLCLWAGLFKLVKVGFFAQAFSQPLFISLATGVMGGIGVVLARGQPRALQIQLQLVLALFRVLLPMLSLVVVLFVLALPFTGVEPLWETRKAAVLLITLQLCLLLFVNAVYQDGLAQDAPYPRLVQQLVHAALWLWPVLGMLGVWAVALRVQQYGWTHDRIWALVATGLLLVYGLGYAWVALQRGRFFWLQGLGRLNARMSWVLLAVGLVLHTPLLDVYRFSAHSQLQRLLQAQGPWSLSQLEDLRFDHGRYGQAALAQLQQDHRAQAPEVQAALQQVQNADRKPRWGRSQRPADPMVQALPFRERVQIANGHMAPERAWWEALESGHLQSYAGACAKANLSAAHSCAVLQLPLKEGAPALPLLCQLQHYAPSCEVFGQDPQGAWRHEGQLSWGAVKQEQRAALRQAMLEGTLRAEPPTWQAVGVPGLEIAQGQVRPSSR